MPEEERRTGTKMKTKTKSTAAVAVAATHVINSSFFPGEGVFGWVGVWFVDSRRRVGGLPP